MSSNSAASTISADRSSSVYSESATDSSGYPSSVPLAAHEYSISHAPLQTPLAELSKPSRDLVAPSKPEDLTPNGKLDFINRLSSFEIDLILAPFESGVLLSDSLLIIRDALSDINLCIEASKLVRILERNNTIPPGSVQLSAPTGHQTELSINQCIERISKLHLGQMLEPVKRGILSRDSMYSVRDMQSGVDFSVSADTLLKETHSDNTCVKVIQDPIGLDVATIESSTSQLKKPSYSRKAVITTIVCLTLLLAAALSVILAMLLSKTSSSDQQIPETTTSESYTWITESMSWTSEAITSASNWPVETSTPTSEETAILLIGGGDTAAKSSMELFYPNNPQLNHVINTQMIQKRWSHTSSLLDDGTVITVGGENFDVAQFVPLSSCERFTPSTSTVTQCPSLNISRLEHASSVLNGIPYVCGGQDDEFKPTNSCEHLVDNVWQSSVPMISKRRQFSMASLNGYLYSMGGFEDDTDSPISTTEKYSATDQQWTCGIMWGGKRIGHSSAVMDGKIYVCGGKDSVGNRLASCERYDPIAEMGTSFAEMNRKRAHFALVTDGKHLFAMGGDEPRYLTAEMYDSKNDTWTMMEKELSYPRSRHSAVLIP